MRISTLLLTLSLAIGLTACSTPETTKTADTKDAKEAQLPVAQRDCVVQTGSNLPRCTREVKSVSGEEFRRNATQPLPSVGRGTP